jgi:hypothetical protein
VPEIEIAMGRRIKDLLICSERQATGPTRVALSFAQSLMNRMLSPALGRKWPGPADTVPCAYIFSAFVTAPASFQTAIINSIILTARVALIRGPFGKVSGNK